jgi:hypothetical protein
MWSTPRPQRTDGRYTSIDVSIIPKPTPLAHKLRINMPLMPGKKIFSLGIDVDRDWIWRPEKFLPRIYPIMDLIAIVVRVGFGIANGQGRLCLAGLKPKP